VTDPIFNSPNARNCKKDSDCVLIKVIAHNFSKPNKEYRSVNRHFKKSHSQFDYAESWSKVWSSDHTEMINPICNHEYVRQESRCEAQHFDQTIEYGE